MTATGNQPSVSIDLVVATIGRTVELERFMDALARQSYRHFRVILVDQNPDDRLVSVVEAYDPILSIVRVRAAAGLSRARNAGLRCVQSDIVAFADDDCWYPPDLLERVATLLHARTDWDGVSGRIIDETGAPSSARWEATGGSVNRFNVWKRGTSATIFLRRAVIEKVGRFDDTLGLGSGTNFGSGEETDYLIRMLDAGFSLHYEPSLTVFHRDNRGEFTPSAIAAGRRYGAGMGRVLRKHYSWRFAVYHCLRALGGTLIALSKQRPSEARFHWAVARGRVEGWRAS